MNRLLPLAFLFSIALSSGAARGDQVWLAVSDVHLNPFDRSSRPSPYGSDTNVALFESAISRMKRAVPNPRVILLGGDFLAHNFAGRAARSKESPEAAAIRTMRWTAWTFERAFPRAQFAIALGNNDVPCGDYRSANGSAYLAAVARAWAPLVNRRGASPNFAAWFARGGYYDATLPLPGTRLVVLNTVLFSSQYRGSCQGDDVQAAAQELLWLRSTLGARTPTATRNLVMMHIPPGFDAFATNYARGLLAWPFLRAQYNAALVEALERPGDRVAYALAAHTHRFDFRLAGHIPIVVLGSLSPVYGNDAAFYALRVSANGSLDDIDAYSFDERMGAWLPPHSFALTWGSGRIDARALTRLHALLAASPAARALWQYQAEGWPSDLVESPGAWGGAQWRVSWCAQTFLANGFTDCAKIKHRVAVLSVLAALIAAALVVLALAAAARRRQA